VATTSTDSFCLPNASNTVARNPYWPIMRSETMSTSVTWFLSTIEVTSTSAMFRMLLIMVPGAVLHGHGHIHTHVCVCAPAGYRT